MTQPLNHQDTLLIPAYDAEALLEGTYFENDGICDNELCYRCGHTERCKKARKERCF